MKSIGIRRDFPRIQAMVLPLFRAIHVVVACLWANPIANSQETPTEIRSQVETGQTKDPSAQNLLFMPTAFTPPQGTIYLRHLEVLFLNLNYATSDWTSIGIGAMLPVTDEFNLLTLSVKQQLLRSHDQTFCIALAGNLYLPIRPGINDGKMLWNGHLVFSSQSIPLAGWHGMVGILETGDKGRSTSITLGLGSKIRLGTHVLLLAEYLGAPNLDQEPVRNAVNTGIRMHGTRFAADLGTVIPVGNHAEWRVFPLLNFSYRF